MKITRTKAYYVLKLTPTEWNALQVLLGEGSALLEDGPDSGFWDNKYEYEAGSRVANMRAPSNEKGPD